MNQAEPLKNSLVSDQDSDWITVGKIKSAHGLKGELYFLVFSGVCDWIDRVERFRIYKEENPLEPRILTSKKMKLFKKGFLMISEEVKNRNQSEEIEGFLVQVPKEILTSHDGEDVYLHEVEGFSVYDEALGLIGPVMGFKSSPAHEYLMVEYLGAERMIPFVEPLLVKICFDSKIINMDLPDGILEL